MRRALDTTFLAAGAAGAACVALIAVLMIVQSLGRVVGVPTGAINDIVSWLAAAAAFLTMAHAFKHGDFVRVTLVLESVRAPLRQGLEFVSLAIAALAIGYLTWWAVRFTYESWQFGEVAQGLLAVPMWIPQLSFALGSLLLWVAVLDELLTVALGGVPGFVRAVQLRHAQGDFSADI